jgi:3-deoxy-D-manno-octulosonic-acid transferase
MPFNKLIHTLYGAVVTAIAPIALASLALKPRGRANLDQRLGLWGLESQCKYVWFHGASAGELRGLIPVLRGWRDRFPEDSLLVTATTVTGLEAIQGLADEARILPFDAPIFIGAALNSVNIKLFVATETELWPSLMSFLRRRRIPSCLINARISQRSFPRYLRVKKVIAPALHNFNWIAAGDEESLDRIRTLMGDAIKGELLGNTKFDVERGAIIHGSDPFWEGYHRDTRPTIVLGCVRPGEETWWFNAFKKLLEQSRDFRIVVAPRHREKFDYFAEKIAEFQFPFIRRSRDIYDPSVPVVLLDQFGELPSVYQGATLSFIGATLVPLGGHNPLEPAAWGSFVVVGPSCDTYETIVKSLVAADAGAIVSSEKEIAQFVTSAVFDPEGMREKGKAGIRVWESQQGATERILSRLSMFRGKEVESP